MSYLLRDDTVYNPYFLKSTESLDPKQDVSFFDPFSEDISHAMPLDINALRFLKKPEGQKHVTNYYWQILFSIEAKRQYKREVEFKSYLIKDRSVYNEVFNFFINEITGFQPNNLIVKVTASDSIYFKFEIDNNFEIRIEAFLDSDDIFSEENTSLIIDNNGEQEYGYLGKPSDVIYKIKDYFSFGQKSDTNSYQEVSSSFQAIEFSPTI